MITRVANLTSRLTIALLFLFGIAACGGGGGGSGGFIPDGDGGDGTPLSIVTTDLPVAAAGADYTALVEADGGDAPYSWAILDDGGTGFSINNEGFLTGTAPERGDYGLTLEVTDSDNDTDKLSVILTLLSVQTLWLSPPLRYPTVSMAFNILRWFKLPEEKNPTHGR